MLCWCFLRAAAARALAQPRTSYGSRQIGAVEAAVKAAVAVTAGRPLEALDAAERESAAIALRVRQRLDSFANHPNCRRCWLQKAHCVCAACPPLGAPTSPVRRVSRCDSSISPYFMRYVSSTRVEWDREYSCSCCPS